MGQLCQYFGAGGSGGGGGGVANPMTSDLDAGGFDINDIGALDASSLELNSGDIAGAGNVSLDGNLNNQSFTSDTALIANHTKNAVSSSVTSAELGYVSGVTSSIQGQFNALVIPQIVSATTQFDKTNTTLASVTGLSAGVSSSNLYSFEAVLFVNASTVGGSKFAIGGTATATSIIYEILLIDNSSNLNTITSRQTSLGGSAGQAGTTAGLCRISGSISVNAGGTLVIQFAQNVANGTSSILVGSYFTVTKIVNPA